MAYDLATVTNSGNQLLASVVSDKSSLVIDKIEVSGTQLASSTDLKSMTSISNVVQTLSANGYQKKDSSFIISTVLDNSSVTADYQAWVFGIWAHETGGGSPILMSVITSTSSPDTITKGSGTPVDYNYKFVTTFSNTSSLTIQMSSDTYAINDTVIHNSGNETATGTKTFQEIKISNDKFPSLVQTDGQYITLDGGNSELIPANDSKVVHTTGNETIDGKKAFKVDPVDGAGNAYAKTVDVNQQLDKKVNVADMRKPANDVVGLEDITQTLLPNGTDFYTLINTAGRPLQYSVTTYVQAQTMINKPTPALSAFILITSAVGNNTNTAYNYTFLNLTDNSTGDSYGALISSDGSGKITVARPWYKIADDSKVVHNTDMRKPASDVVGLEDITTAYNQGAIADGTDVQSITKEGLYQLNGISLINFIGSGKLWGTFQVIYQGGAIFQIARMTDGSIYTNVYSGSPASWIGWNKLADDSKVAHLSGANNFDTTPTVNNNPLLLASSLPSDLARLSHDANFTAKLQQNGQDVALANNTIARNPNTGTVSETNTFTAAQTFSIAPTITDASKDKGDNQAATMADLKSVENSAWRSVNLSDDAKGMGFDNAFYLKNETTKQFTLIFTGTPSGVNSVFSTPKTLFTDSEISAYTNVSALSGVFGTQWSDSQESNNELDLTASISNNSIMFKTSFYGGIQDNNPSHFSHLNWIGYGKIAGTYK